MNGKKEILLETKTGGAQLYSVGAYLQRECVTEVPAGISELIFDGLSADTDVDRVYVETVGEVDILSQVVESSVGGEDKYRELKRELTQARSELQLLENDVALIAGEIALLDANRNIGCGGDKDKIEEFAGYYLKKVKTLLTRRASREAALEESRAEVARLQAETEKAGLRKARRVRLTVSALKDTMADFSLRYFVPTACWEPRYEVRSEGEGDDLRIALKAAVSNESGENWQDARLSFSTGTPLRSQSVPEFVPEYVPVQKVRPMLRAAAFTAEAAPAYAGQALREETETERIFTSRGLYDVPDGVKELTVELESVSSPARYGYECVSSEAQAVFFTAETEVRLSVPYASANMFLHGRFCGSGEVREAEDGKIKFCFGVDSGIAVKREQLADYTAKKLGGAEKTDKCYIITVKNNKSCAVTVTVTDRIPVSVNKAVSVESALSAGAKLDKAKGKVEWTVRLEPGASSLLKAQYSVTAAKT